MQLQNKADQSLKWENLLFELLEIAHQFSNCPSRFKGCIQLSQAEAKVFEIIAEQPQTLVSEIANRFGITNSATSQIVEKLVKKKFVVRTHSHYDRRSIHLDLTSLGKKTWKSQKACRQNLIDTLMNNLISQTDEKKMNSHLESIQSLLFAMKITLKKN